MPRPFVKPADVPPQRPCDALATIPAPSASPASAALERSRNSRFQKTLVKVLGNRARRDNVGIIASDAKRVLDALLPSLPAQSPAVRVVLALHARHVAMNAYYTALAESSGLDTPEGVAFLEVADRQSVRAERTLVTAMDLAKAHVQQKSGMPFDPLAAFEVAAAAMAEAVMRRRRGDSASDVVEVEATVVPDSHGLEATAPDPTVTPVPRKRGRLRKVIVVPADPAAVVARGDATQVDPFEATPEDPGPGVIV